MDKKEREMLEKDPFSHFLKYVKPFMTKEEEEEASKLTIFDFLCDEEE